MFSQNRPSLGRPNVTTHIAALPPGTDTFAAAGGSGLYVGVPAGSSAVSTSSPWMVI